MQGKELPHQKVIVHTNMLRNDLYHIGVAMCLQLILTVLIFVIVMLGSIGYQRGVLTGKVITFLTNNDNFLTALILIFTGALANTLPFIMCLQRMHLTFSDFNHKVHLPFRNYCLYIMTCIGVNYVGGFIGNMLTKDMSLFDSISNYFTVTLNSKWIGDILMLIYMLIIAPITEEFMCRGVILHGLRRYGEWFALLTSSVLFGLLHGNLRQFIAATLIGLILGMISLKEESIKPTIIVHMINNLIVVTLNKVYTYIPDDQLMVDTLVGVIMILCAICIIIKYMRDYRPRKNTSCYKPQYRGAFFRAWPLELISLIYIVMIICQL